MIRIENTRVMNFESAIHGMRNPLESWDKSDSIYLNTFCNDEGMKAEMYDSPLVNMGEADHKLALNLATAGSDHGKFMRQIFVSVDLTAPIYWWKEFDTYKVGTVANSTSTMHKITSRLLTPEDFSWDDDKGVTIDFTYRRNMLNDLNKLIVSYKECDDPVIKKRIWRRLIQDLPSSFNQTRTVTLNYEVLRNMYFARNNHKLVEWRILCKWIESLPYSELITTPRKSPELAESIIVLEDIYKYAETSEDNEAKLRDMIMRICKSALERLGASI